MKAQPHDVLGASLCLFALLGLLVYSCAVNPVTRRSELALVSFSEEVFVSAGVAPYTREAAFGKAAPEKALDRFRDDPP